LFFDELPDMAPLLGSLMIIASCLYIVVRERTGERSIMRPVLTTLSRLRIAPAAYSTTCGHLFHAHVASHSMTCGHTREVICEAVSS
jgi:hypothetical protein